MAKVLSKPQIAANLAVVSGFDLAGALKANHTYDDIIEYLKSHPGKMTPRDAKSRPVTTADMRAAMRLPPKAPPKSGLWGASARMAAPSVLPTVGAIPAAFVGGAAGAGAGEALALAGGAAFPPAFPVLQATLPIVGGIGGALYGGLTGAEKVTEAQDWVAAHLPEGVRKPLASLLGQTPEQRQADVTAHPFAAKVAPVLPAVLAGRPTTNLARTALGAVAGGGFDLAQQIHRDPKHIDWPQVGISAAAGAATAKPSLLGRVFGRPETALEEHLRKTKVNPEDVSAQRDAVAEAGVTQPTLLDVVPPRNLMSATARASRSSGAAQDLLNKYAGVVRTGAESTARLGRRAVAALPGGSRTRQQRATEAETTIEEPAPGVIPAVESGEGGAAVSRKLNSIYDAREGDFQNAYGAADESGPALLQQVDPKNPEAVWKPTSENGKKGYVNALTEEFVPEADFGPANSNDLATAVRTAVTDAHHDFEAFPKELGGVEAIIAQLRSASTVKDLFVIARKLNKAAQSNDATTSSAANIAKKAVYDQIYKLDEAGRFADEYGYTDSEPVKLWKEAVRQRSKFGATFENGDAVEALTTRKRDDVNPGKEKPALDETSATKHLIGDAKRVAFKTNAVPDFIKIRDLLGADSPEWKAFADEAIKREVTADYGTSKFGTAWNDFKSRKKDLYDVLVSPDAEARIVRAQAVTKDALGSLDALKVGDAFLDTNPTDFRDGLARNPTKTSEAQTSARASMDAALADPAAAAAYLVRLKEHGNVTPNLEALMGPDAVATFLRKANALAEREANVSAADPGRVGVPVGSPATDTSGARGAANLATGRVAGALGSLTGYLENKGMSPEAALRYARDVTDPAKTDETIVLIKKMYGENAAQAFGRRAHAVVRNNPAIYAVAQGSAIAASRDVQSELDKKPTPEEAPVDTAPIDYSSLPDEEINAAPENPYSGLSDEEVGAAPQKGQDAQSGASVQKMSYDTSNLDALTRRQIKAESAGNPNAVSPKGARGLMQLMPDTAAKPGFGIEPAKDTSISENLRVGTEYRDKLIEKYGSVPLGLAAYNWGPGNVDRWLRSGRTTPVPQETTDYVRRVYTPPGAITANGVPNAALLRDR